MAMTEYQEKIVQVLEAAAFVEAGAHCKGRFARTVDGFETSTTSKSAASFCAVGALREAARTLKISPTAVEMAQIALRKTVCKTVVTFNDSPDTTGNLVAEKMLEAAELVKRGELTCLESTW